MTLRTLITRSLRFHWRGHLGVLLGAAVGSAALIGALVVGDSVRLSLRELALQRLGNVSFAMETGDRNFRSGIDKVLASGISEPLSASERRARGLIPVIVPTNTTLFFPVTASNRFASVTTTNVVQLQGRTWLGLNPFATNQQVNASSALKLDATAATQGGQSRANKIQLFGVSPEFGLVTGSASISNLPPDSVMLNESLAAQLRVSTGDVVTIRTRKPDALGGDSPLAPQDETAVVLRMKVHSILSGAAGGNFNLSASQVPPYNAFVSLAMLQEKAGVPHRANLLIADTPVETWWRKPEFSWGQWVGDRLRRLGLNAIPPPSMGVKR